MSSLNVKQEKDSEFTGYPLAPSNSNEIDLLSLVDVLWRAKNRIIATVFAFALAGILLSFILPQKWTSRAIVTPAEAVQWQELEKTLTTLRVLNLDINLQDRKSVV